MASPLKDRQRPLATLSKPKKTGSGRRGVRKSCAARKSASLRSTRVTAGAGSAQPHPKAALVDSFMQELASELTVDEIKSAFGRFVEENEAPPGDEDMDLGETEDVDIIYGKEFDKDTRLEVSIMTHGSHGTKVYLACCIPDDNYVGDLELEWVVFTPIVEFSQRYSDKSINWSKVRECFLEAVRKQLEKVG